MSAGSRFCAACACGQVAFEATGAPILSAVCYCEDCRTAARGFEQAPGAPIVLGRDGGVEYCLFRKDRVALVRGGSLLEAHRLTETSATRRVVASCCNAPMFLDFTKGHWLTIYRDRLPAGAPPVEMGVMARDRPAGQPRGDGVPIYPAFPARFLFRVMIAWAKMGFRRVALTW